MSTSPPLVVADRYRLVAPLGQGGMGRVWRATDVVLHREVAIKELVPPPGLTPEERQEMRERSLREARAIARLNNINVVRVFDVLRTDADPWIVMEYVPSRSLQDRLATDGPFPPVRAAEIGLGVLNALRAAHRNGVVHRDVKPGNVLIGEDGRVVLTDFGLATVPGDPNVTRTGLVLGSPAYIAPERARDGTAGPAADMWSLGATLYAAVEGASPFARSSAIATLAALATENPPPARNAGPLKPVLNGLLRKDPTHRINAEEAERLLLRAAGRKSKLTFPMSPTMRRPGVGRERPAYQAGPPVIPGMPAASGSAPVVPGPRPPVTSGRPPVSPGPASRDGGPPVTPGRTSGEDRPPVFTPGKATVGRAPRPADTRLDTPAVRDDQELPGTGYSAAPSALAKGTPATYGTITPGTAPAEGEAAAARPAPDRAEAGRAAAGQAAEPEAVTREAANRATRQRKTTERETEQRAAAEREAEQRAAAEREAEQRAAAEREAEQRAAAERDAEQRAAAEREAEQRAAAERDAAQRAVAEREAEQRPAAEREAARRAAAERGTAEREAGQRATAEPAVAERAEREAELGKAPRGATAADRRTADEGGADSGIAAEQEATAGGPLIGAGAGHAEEDDAEETTPAQHAEVSPVDAPTTARKAAGNKPVVGARAGAHSTSKAARKKGRGRTGTGTGASRPRGTRAAANVDADPATAASAAEVNAASATSDGSATAIPADAEATAVETPAAVTADDLAVDDAERAAREEPEAADEPQTADEPAAANEPQAADEPAAPDQREAAAEAETATPDERSEAATVVSMRTGTDEGERSTNTTAGSKTRPKVAAARSTERKVTTATLATDRPNDAVSVPMSRSAAATVPDSPATGTPPLDDAAGVGSFTTSSRPAWQPMPVRPAKPDRGLTVLGTTLTRRQTVLGAAILAAILLLLALLVPKAVGDDKQNGRTAGGAPVASAAATPTTTPATTRATPSQQATSKAPPSKAPATTAGGAVALPSGWHLYHDSTGFSVPVPDGWNPVRRGSEVYFAEPGGQYRLLIVDQTNKPKPDPVKDWETQEAARISSYRNYHRISIHAVSYWDKAADWEYTRTSDNGNPLHVVKRGFITAKDQAYGITWSTSAGDWNANKANLQLIYKGFVPAKS